MRRANCFLLVTPLASEKPSTSMKLKPAEDSTGPHPPWACCACHGNVGCSPYSSTTAVQRRRGRCEVYVGKGSKKMVSLHGGVSRVMV
ncbi:hypothetical protein IEQ34_004308 [Dendrobium chrysotoxum]|uniref:Secreted protein n=1 Tax=Dendrobium chrysotoxum TaxID=161865 RepID=A0AAV7GZ30_DENCH|nr:hypothetical protein IEQ34_004308 [Dendrobium chrysotoxum]